MNNREQKLIEALKIARDWMPIAPCTKSGKDNCRIVDDALASLSPDPMETPPMTQLFQECPSCGGEGYLFNSTMDEPDTCEDCGGNRYVPYSMETPPTPTPSTEDDSGLTALCGGASATSSAVSQTCNKCGGTINVPGSYILVSGGGIYHLSCAPRTSVAAPSPPKPEADELLVRHLRAADLNIIDPDENALNVAADRIEELTAELASVRERIASEARRYAEMYPQSSDGRNTFIIFAEWVEAGAISKPAEKEKGE